MTFQNLQIRFQTARSLPAPYAYFYTLNAYPIASGEIHIEIAITYPDRDDIDDDELIAEGYTRDDDFSWEGKLPTAWLDSLSHLVRKTKLETYNEDELDEDEDFWALTIDTQQGRPTNTDHWQYLMQELIQATYELIGRERPFELTYLNLSAQGEQEFKLTASFAKRSITVIHRDNKQERTRTLPWPTLQKLMSTIYEHDFTPEETHLKRPKQNGKWLNLGQDDWYDVTQLNRLTKIFQTF